MVNNGYLVDGSCLDVYSFAERHCSVSTPDYLNVILVNSSTGIGYVTCHVQSGAWLNTLHLQPFSCAVSGPPLTETEQIQAINQLLPYALAFLAAIWGGKKVFDLLWGAAFRPRRVSDSE